MDDYVFDFLVIELIIKCRMIFLNSVFFYSFTSSNDNENHTTTKIHFISLMLFSGFLLNVIKCWTKKYKMKKVY